MNIGIIGVGKMGSLHAEKFSALGRQVYLYDSKLWKASAVAKKLNVHACETLEHIMHKSDAIVVATPATSLDVANLALMAGKHVLVEKPMATTTFDARMLKNLAMDKNLNLSVGYVEKFHPCIFITNFLLQNQKPIHMTAVRSSIYTSRGTDVSVVKDMMVHDIYRALMINNGSVVSIEADGKCTKSKELDSAYAKLQFEDGFLAFISVTRDSNSTHRKHSVTTKDHVYSVDLVEGTIVETLGGFLSNRDFNFPNEDPLMAQAKDFIDAVEGNRYESVHIVERAIRTLEIAEDIENKIKEENEKY